MKRVTKPSVLLLAVLAGCIGEPETERASGAIGESCYVTTALGDIQGVDNGSSCTFLGIRFAAATSGANRWKPPVPVAPWAPAVVNATAAGPACAANEDCLRLNVWVSDPPPVGPAPVIVWMHTGGFTGASPNFASHNGRKMAEETGAIVVAPAYRLGALGFLSHSALEAEDPNRVSAGNYGLLDQRAALEWVQDNIAAFGGDPNAVTLAGTSAGGQSVGLQLVSPGSAGLFQRAIIESAYPTTRWTTREEAQAQGDAFATALGCTDPDPALLLSCLRGKTVAQVAAAIPTAPQAIVEVPGAVWEPNIDGVELPDQPRRLFATGQFHRVPIVVGHQHDEGWGPFITRSFPTGVTLEQYEGWVASEFGDDAATILSLYPAASFATPEEAMARVVGDGQFVCEARRLAFTVSLWGVLDPNTRAYLYSFDEQIDQIGTFYGGHVIHGLESNILFGNNYTTPNFPVAHVLDATDNAVHATMQGYWTRFAATGVPGGTPTWSKYSVLRPRQLTINTTTTLDSAADLRCLFWAFRDNRSMFIPVPASAP